MGFIIKGCSGKSYMAILYIFTKYTAYYYPGSSIALVLLCYPLDMFSIPAVFSNPSKGVGGCVSVLGYSSQNGRLSSRSGEYSSGSRRNGTGHRDKDCYKMGCIARKISKNVANPCTSGGEDSSPGGGCYSTKGCGNIFRDFQRHRGSNCVAGGYGTAHVGRCVCDYSRASNSVDIC